MGWETPHNWIGGEGISEALLDQISNNLNFLKENVAWGKLLSALTTDHTVSGVCIDATAGEALVFGNFCYLKNDGKMWKADASAASTMPILYMAAASISADASGVFLRNGIARDDSWTWSDEGVRLYASTTAGEITETKPSGSGDQVQPVGIAINATHIDYQPSMEITPVP